MKLQENPVIGTFELKINEGEGEKKETKKKKKKKKRKKKKKKTRKKREEKRRVSSYLFELRGKLLASFSLSHSFSLSPSLSLSPSCSFSPSSSFLSLTTAKMMAFQTGKCKNGHRNRL